MTRRVLSAAALALACATLTACGGGDDGGGGDGGSGGGGSEVGGGLAGGDDSSSTPSASGVPTDATVADFCAAVEMALTSIGEQADKADDEVLDVSDAVAALEETGTPQEIPADAQDGFGTLVDALRQVDGLTVAEAEEVDSPGDSPEGEAFSAYFTATCTPA